jgi:catechol 2,3-dioxygenase-like lactoylglutathione lyase family enzyme
VAKTVAHICILVADIERAIQDFNRIFSRVAPGLVRKPAVRQERFTEDEKYITAFFGAVGDGCDIQLLQPPDEASPLYRRLRKHGEGIHHIAFSTSHLEDTYQALKRDGVSVSDRLYAEHPDGDESTDVRHCWILPASAHGALIELIDSYGVVNGLLTKAD